MKILVNGAFDSLSTQHKQDCFFKDQGEFVEPVEVIDAEVGTKFGCIIPFEEKLKNLLSIPETEQLDFDRTHLDILRSMNIKSNLNDGVFIQDAIKKQMENRVHPQTSQGVTVQESTLYFALYYDDIEIVNAIGSSRTKHKLGEFVFNK